MPLCLDVIANGSAAMYYVYILECECDKFYVGMTSDLEHRLIAHLSNNGSVFTKKYSPISLFYVEELRTRDEAISVETYYTKLFKVKKQELKLEEKYKNIFDDVKQFINKNGNDCWYRIKQGELNHALFQS